MCGSCWAIAASSVLQAHSEIYASSARTFSPQELVSCVPNPNKCGGDGGCEGSTVELALQWVMENGLAPEHQVPYVALDSVPCRSNSPNASEAATLAMMEVDASDVGASLEFGMTGWTKLPENRYEPVMRALVERGPAAVSVGARDWHSYAKGIFDSCEKDTVVNHALILLGFGVEQSSGVKYWSLLNSWGQEWGENGLIRLLRQDSDESEQCGMDKSPQVGTGCKGGPAEVRVCGMCGILYDATQPIFSGQMSDFMRTSALQVQADITA